MESNFVFVSREITEWNLYGDANAMALLMHFALSTSATARKSKGVNIPPGSILTSITDISENLGWSRNTVKKTVDRLAEDGAISIETIKARRGGSRKMLVSVNKIMDNRNQISCSNTCSDISFNSQNNTQMCSNFEQSYIYSSKLNNTTKQRKEYNSSCSSKFIDNYNNNDSDFSSYCSFSQRPLPSCVEEVQSEAIKMSIEMSYEEAMGFLEYNSARGWMVGNRPVMDWTKLLPRWHRMQIIIDMNSAAKNDKKLSNTVSYTNNTSLHTEHSHENEHLKAKIESEESIESVSDSICAIKKVDNSFVRKANEMAEMLRLGDAAPNCKEVIALASMCRLRRNGDIRKRVGLFVSGKPGSGVNDFVDAIKDINKKIKQVNASDVVAEFIKNEGNSNSINEILKIEAGECLDSSDHALIINNIGDEILTGGKYDKNLAAMKKIIHKRYCFWKEGKYKWDSTTIISSEYDIIKIEDVYGKDTADEIREMTAQYIIEQKDSMDNEMKIVA